MAPEMIPSLCLSDAREKTILVRLRQLMLTHDTVLPELSFFLLVLAPTKDGDPLFQLLLEWHILLVQAFLVCCPKHG
jgi:hypothetical protein